MLDPSNPRHARAIRRLQAEPVAWLTTVRPNGQPQTSPVWFLYEDGTFLVYSKPNTAKVTNITANPKASINLDGDRFGGEVVTLEATADIDSAIPRASDNPTYIEKYRLFMRRNGWSPEDFSRDYSIAIRLTPNRARAW